VEYIIDMDNNNELIEKRTGLTIFYFILFFWFNKFFWS
jgi:hypothetical protein